MQQAAIRYRFLCIIASGNVNQLDFVGFTSFNKEGFARTVQSAAFTAVWVKGITTVTGLEKDGMEKHKQEMGFITQI